MPREAPVAAPPRPSRPNVFLVVMGALLFANISGVGVGLLTDYWEVTKVNTTSVGEKEFRSGLFKYCWDGLCSDIQYNPVSYNNCSTTSDNVRMRYWIVRGLFFLAVFMGICALITLVVGSHRPPKPGKLHVVPPWLCWLLFFLVLGAASDGAATGLYMFSNENMWFCAQGSCGYVGSVYVTLSCSAKYGYSFYVTATSTASVLLALILSFVFWVRAKREVNANAPDDDGDGGESRARGGAARRSRGVAAEASSSGRADAGATSPQPHEPQRDGEDVFVDIPEGGEPVPNGRTKNTAAPTRFNPPADFELPEGDWEFDPESGMYWSQEQYLFLHPETNNYYDPNSDSWWDPVTQEWYGAGANS